MPTGTVNTARRLFVKGPTIGLPKDIPFRADREYTFCRVCGALFQPHLERVPAHLYTAQVIERSSTLQRAWATKHAKTHPGHVHESFRKSGAFLSPEATLALVPYGILPISDIVLNDENEHAGLQAPRLSGFDNFNW